jgi:hypothetical protein
VYVFFFLTIDPVYKSDAGKLGTPFLFLDQRRRGIEEKHHHLDPAVGQMAGGGKPVAAHRMVPGQNHHNGRIVVVLLLHTALAPYQTRQSVVKERESEENLPMTLKVMLVAAWAAFSISIASVSPASDSKSKKSQRRFKREIDAYW